MSPRTFAITKGASGGGGGASDYLSVLTSAEISITGATTATIGRQHVVTGTASNYTITLPATAGLAGKFLSFRFGPTLTELSKLVTLDGNASEKIDGALTRICWAGESCVLFTDGSNWFKIPGGKTIPMLATMHLSASQSGIVTATATKILIDTIDVDNTGQMGDTTNKRINIKRPGTYQWFGAVPWVSIGAATRTLTMLYAGINGVVSAQQNETECPATANSFPTSFCLAQSTLFIANDLCEIYGYQTSGINATVFGSATLSGGGCQLNVVEIPSW